MTEMRSRVPVRWIATLLMAAARILAEIFSPFVPVNFGADKHSAAIVLGIDPPSLYPRLQIQDPKS